MVWLNPEYSGLKSETTQISKTKFVAPGLEDLLGETELMGIIDLGLLLQEAEGLLQRTMVTAHHELGVGDVQRKIAFGENKRRPELREQRGRDSYFVRQMVAYQFSDVSSPNWIRLWVGWNSLG